MPIGTAALAIGGSVVSGLFGAAAAESASKTQAKSAKEALALEQQMYAQARTDLSPYRTAGSDALGSISSLYGYANPTTGAPASGPVPGTPDYSSFFTSPDYNFAVQQGVLALDRSAASKGLLTSGGQLKDLTSFGQGLASQQYGNYFNRLLQIATLGQNSAATSAAAAQAFGVNGATQINNQGAATASGAVGAANALSTIPQNLLYASFLGGQSPTSYANTATAALDPNSYLDRGGQFANVTSVGT